MQNGEIQLLATDPNLASQTRGVAIQQAAAARLTSEAARLERRLSTRGRYLSLTGVPLGFRWLVQNADGSRLRVRTEGNRLYLDGELVLQLPAAVGVG